MNLAKTQAQWTRLLGREVGASFFAPMREAREQFDKFSRERTQIVPLTQLMTVNVAALSLAGVDAGVNTAVDGSLWARFTANGGNWDVSFYKAAGAGGGDEVASITNVADGATSALTEENASGISGSITLGAAVVAVADDYFKMLVVVDYPARLPKVFTQVDGIEQDPRGRQLLTALYARCRDRRQAEIDDIKATLQTYLCTKESKSSPLARGNAFNSSAETSLATDEEVTDGDSGNVSRKRNGLLPIMSINMQDEATGGEQDIPQRVVAAGAGAFDSGNALLATVASHTPSEKTPIGVWTFQCDDGADTGALGRETFSGGFAATDGSGETFSFSGVRIERDFTGPRGIGPFRIRRTYSKTGDGSNLNLAAVTTGILTGESDANTEEGTGLLYWKIVANGSNWDVEFYRDSLRTKLVAKATNYATGAAFQATEQNSSGLTVTWTVGSAPVTTTTGTLACNPAFVENASRGLPDRFTITTSLSGTAGVWQTMLAEELNATLNSDTAGSASIPDAYVMQGTFPPFLALLN